MAMLYRYLTTTMPGRPYLQYGSPITVDGDPMVKLPGGFFVPAANYHSSKAEAVEAVNVEIEAGIAELRRMIDELRHEASREA